MHEDVRMTYHERFNEFHQMLSDAESKFANVNISIILVVSKDFQNEVLSESKTILQNGHLTGICNTLGEIVTAIKEKLN